jgi:RNA polymerase sigma factor (sigma-70 family)
LARLNDAATARLSDAMGRYVDGDLRAFDEVYGTLAPIVRGCLRRWIRDAALVEDLVQETFLRVHRARDRYRPGTPAGAWVVTIARRLAIDAMRSGAVRRDRVTLDGDLPESNVWFDEPADAEEAAAIVQGVQAAVSALPAGMQVVVAMHHFDGRSLVDVAETLGISHSAAKVRAHRGYGKLREGLVRLFERQRER